MKHAAVSSILLSVFAAAATSATSTPATKPAEAVAVLNISLDYGPMRLHQVRSGSSLKSKRLGKGANSGAAVASKHPASKQSASKHPASKQSTSKQSGSKQPASEQSALKHSVSSANHPSSTQHAQSPAVGGARSKRSLARQRRKEAAKRHFLIVEAVPAKPRDQSKVHTVTNHGVTSIVYPAKKSAPASPASSSQSTGSSQASGSKPAGNTTTIVLETPMKRAAGVPAPPKNPIKPLTYKEKQAKAQREAASPKSAPLTPKEKAVLEKASAIPRSKSF